MRRGCLITPTQPPSSLPRAAFDGFLCCSFASKVHLPIIPICASAKPFYFASTYAMLCHLCQNLVFLPVEELNLQNVGWLTDRSFVYMPDMAYISVHQPSQKALELSAGHGCRVCALFWFRLFQRTGSTNARRYDDHEVAPIFLFMNKLPWDEGFETRIPEVFRMKLCCGEDVASLKVGKPIPGMSDEHVP